MRRARDQRDVVGQAGMRQAAVAGERRIMRSEGVEVRRVGTPEHIVPRLVLQHDDEHVLEPRHIRFGGIGTTDESRQGECQETRYDGPAQDSVSARSTRFFARRSAGLDQFEFRTERQPAAILGQPVRPQRS